MSEQYLTFKVDQQTYGIKISAIREINRISQITKIPEVPDYVAGVMDLRGRVIPVVSLRLRMRMNEIDVTRETCTIIVDTSAGQIGIVVDAVSSVLSLEDSQISHTPVQQGTKNYIFGIGKVDSKMVMLIDIEKCLAEDGDFQGIPQQNQRADVAA